MPRSTSASAPRNGSAARAIGLVIGFPACRARRRAAESGRRYRYRTGGRTASDAHVAARQSRGLLSCVVSGCIPCLGVPAEQTGRRQRTERRLRLAPLLSHKLLSCFSSGKAHREKVALHTAPARVSALTCAPGSAATVPNAESHAFTSASSRALRSRVPLQSTPLTLGSCSVSTCPRSLQHSLQEVRANVTALCNSSCLQHTLACL